MGKFKIIIVVFFLFISTAIYSQSKVFGYLHTEAGEPLIQALVQLTNVKDSTKFLRTYTSIEGRYVFENLKGGSYRLDISVLGFKPVSKQLMLFKDTKQEVNLVLKEDKILLPEVQVQGAAGYIVKGDTTTYFTNRFITGQEKTLKDVLEQLPGMRIDANSNTITSNGKPIRKILLEKQDLFQGNTSIPLENLSSEGIKSVEVIDNYSEYNVWEGFRQSNETVINVNMGDKMKGKISGQADIQGGIKEKYYLKNSALLIGKKAMVSGIIAGNNMGEQLLKPTDLISMNGSYSELLSSGNPEEKMQSLVKSYSPFIDGRKNVYKRDNGLVSLNAVFFPSPKLKVLWNGVLGLDRYKLNSNDHYEYLTSNLKYDNLREEKQNKQHLLSNLKINYSPRKDLKFFYTGNISIGKRQQDLLNVVFDNPLNIDTKNNVFISKNNLLAVKSFGTNSLNLSLDFDYNRGREDYEFQSDSIFYKGLFGLSDEYLYHTNLITRRFSAELFYLHRLGDSFFFRLGTQSLYNEDIITPNLTPQDNVNLYSKYNYLDVFTQTASMRVGKDLGKFTFTAGLNFIWMNPQFNFQREFAGNNKQVLTPHLKLGYKFTPTHMLDFSYDKLYRTHAITDLIDGYRISSYDYIVKSEINKPFSNIHKLGLRQISVFPFSGITLMNMVSFEYEKDGVVNDYNLRYIINDVSRRLSSGTKKLTVMSLIDKKFMFMPLSAKLSGYYNHIYAPFYNAGEFYTSKNDSWVVVGEANTHYKRGFNGELMVNYMRGKYKSDIGNNKYTNVDYRAALTFNTTKFYASCGIRYRDYHMQANKNHNIFYDFEVRYTFSKKFTLQMVGDDIIHTSSRVLSESRVESYYNLYRTVRYMPGSIRIGAIIKY